MGSSAPIAIEIDSKPFAPIVDLQNTIRQLVDWQTAELAFQNNCDAFGKGTTNEIPYAYVGKRLDPSTGLIYFGKRFYDPNIGRWLTLDPIGPVDHSNLYQYVFNNPFTYYDPNGESLGGYLLGLGEIALGFTCIATAGVLEFATLGGYTIGFALQVETGVALIAGGIATTSYHGQDLSFTSKFTPTDQAQEYLTDGLLIIPAPEGAGNLSCSRDIYAPDRPLPLTEDGVFIPDTDAPHTQLGTKKGRKGKYPQAREFDGDGNPIRDIDFTDHGRPKNHPNPHQHERKPNPSGGTRIRDPKGLPVKGWNY